MSDTPNVFQSIAAVSAAAGAVGKDGDSGQGYKYRRVDDVINALHGPLCEHGVVIVPRIVKFESEPMDRKNWTRTVLEVEFVVYGPAGDSVAASAIGESHNNSDKGPGAAMSYAYKTVMGQLFSLPTDDPKMDNEHSDDQLGTLESSMQEVEREALIQEIKLQGQEVNASMVMWCKTNEVSLRKPMTAHMFGRAQTAFFEYVAAFKDHEPETVQAGADDEPEDEAPSGSSAPTDGEDAE